MVHTTGFNWDSLGAIGALVLAAFLAVGSYVRRSIKTSVDHLADVLEARLASNDDVNKIKDDVTGLKVEIRELKERRR